MHGNICSCADTFPDWYKWVRSFTFWCKVPCCCHLWRGGGRVGEWILSHLLALLAVYLHVLATFPISSAYKDSLCMSVCCACAHKLQLLSLSQSCAGYLHQNQTKREMKLEYKCLSECLHPSFANILHKIPWRGIRIFFFFAHTSCSLSIICCLLEQKSSVIQMRCFLCASNYVRLLLALYFPSTRCLKSRTII